MNQINILFSGEETSVSTRTGDTSLVRVRIMPIRHLLELIDLFEVGRESDLIQRCTERKVGESWEPCDSAFVDSLSDESHVALASLAEKLNFQRAIRHAERQIARSETLRPLKEQIAREMLMPLRNELASWTSQLTQQLSSAVAAKKS